MKAIGSGSVQVITRLRGALSGRTETISAQILRGATGTAVLRIINTGLTFAIAIALARFLGVEEYGIYAYAMSWVTLLGVVAGLGLNQVIVADVAVYHQNNDWAHIRGMLRFALAAVAGAGVLCGLVIAGVGWLVHREDQALSTALLLASLLLPFTVLLVPFGASQNGLRQVTFAQVPQMLVMPATFLALFASSFGLGVFAPSAGSALVLQVIAVAGALIVAALLLRKGLATAGRPKILPKPQYEPKAWIVSGLPMILMGSMFLVNSNADILMLGALASTETAGLYKAAARGAELLTYGLVIVSLPLGPVVARLYATGEVHRLQRELRRWAHLAFIPTLFLAAVFFFRGDWFLGLFGPDFVTDEARIALAILTGGQLIHAAAGPVGLLLIMTAHRGVTARVLTVAAILNVILNALFIPTFGLIGAAVATALSTALFALLLVRYAARTMKLNTTVIPLFSGMR